MIVKDSRKSDWVYVVMAVSQFVNNNTRDYQLKLLYHNCITLMQGSCRVVKRFVDSTETTGRRQPLQSYPATGKRTWIHGY